LRSSSSRYDGSVHTWTESGPTKSSKCCIVGITCRKHHLGFVTSCHDSHLRNIRISSPLMSWVHKDFFDVLVNWNRYVRAGSQRSSSSGYSGCLPTETESGATLNCAPPVPGMTEVCIPGLNLERLGTTRPTFPQCPSPPY